MSNLPRFALAIMCLLALAGCSGGGGPKPAKSGGGTLPDNIDGTYQIHSMNYQGEIRLPDEVAERMRESARKVVFDSGKMTMQMQGSDRTYDISIDRSKSPALITFTTELDGKPVTTYGVITMINDQLTVCHFLSSYGLKPEERPTEIKNGPAIVTVKLNKQS